MIRDLQKRPEPSIDRKISRHKLTDLKSIESRFLEAIKNIRNQKNVLDQIKEKKISGEVDILRSQVMFLDSALDYYVHEIVKYGIEKIFTNAPNWEETNDFKKIKVSLYFTKEIYQTPEQLKDIFNELDYSLPSYMKYDAISKSLIMIGVFGEERIPEKIAGHKKDIDEISNRRNAIVHAFDRTFSGKQKYLDENIVQKYISNICSFQQDIHKSIIIKDKKGKTVTDEDLVNFSQ